MTDSKVPSSDRDFFRGPRVSISQHAMEAASEAPSHKLSRKLAVLTVLMASLCLGFGASIMRTFGIMYVEVQKHYNSSAATGSTLNSLFLGSVHFFGPISTMLLNTFGYTTTISFGSLLLIAGVFSSAFVPSAEWLFLTFGVIPGIGIGIINHAVYTFIGKVFDRRRPLANNMLQVIPGLIMIHMRLQHFIDNYGLPCSLLRVSGFVAISFPTGFILTFLPKYYPREVRNRMQEQKITKMFSTDLLKEKALMIYLLYCGFDTSVNTLLSLYCFKFANSLGVESIQMTYILTAYAVLSIIIGLLTGWIYSKRYVCGMQVNRLSILIFCVALRFLGCVLLAMFATNFTTLCATFMFLQISYGCIGGLPQTVVADLVGHERLSGALGLRMFAMGLFAIVTSPLTEYLLERMSTSLDDPSNLYRIPMVLSAVFSFVSLLVIIHVRKYSR